MNCSGQFCDEIISILENDFMKSLQAEVNSVFVIGIFVVSISIVTG